ncbi:hypothetical protein L9F63_001074, partial [Diploptera punctata]
TSRLQGRALSNLKILTPTCTNSFLVHLISRLESTPVHDLFILFPNMRPEQCVLNMRLYFRESVWYILIPLETTESTSRVIIVCGIILNMQHASGITIKMRLHELFITSRTCVS